MLCCVRTRARVCRAFGSFASALIPQTSSSRRNTPERAIEVQYTYVCDGDEDDEMCVLGCLDDDAFLIVCGELFSFFHFFSCLSQSPITAVINDNKHKHTLTGQLSHTTTINTQIIIKLNS